MPLKAKICHLTSVHPPFDTRIFHKECKSLVKAGYEVHLVVRHNKDEMIGGVCIHAVPTFHSRIKRMTYTIWAVYKKALEIDAQIYHFHDPELMLIGLLLKLKGKKVIYDVHENYPKAMMSKYYLPVVFRKFISLLFLFAERLFSGFFDYIIVVNDDIAENFQNIDKKKVIILRNTPLIEFVNACNTDNRNRNNKVLYTGGLSRIRGIKEIIESIIFVKNDVMLVLIGSFETPEFEKEMRMIANKKVQFVGNVHYKEIPEFIKTSKIGIICFYPEPNHIGAILGGNNKFYEYMAGGLPIIASNIPEWKKVIEGENFGITVDPKNPKEIASAIDYLLDNPVISAEMGRNGLNAVREKYNWENEGKKFLKFYEKVLQ